MLTNDPSASPAPRRRDHSLLILLVLLFAALSVICHQAYSPHDIMWANDTQLGPLKNASSNPWGCLVGHWLDHWWIGQGVPNNAPSISNLYEAFLTPELYLKTFTPVSMLLLGFSAWFLFRQLKFSPMVCVVGGLVAGLNMHAFSIGTWGLPTWNVSLAMVFLALAALVTKGIRQNWIKAILAGIAVGFCVMDGFDCGAILSVFVGVFIVFYSFISQPGAARKIANSIIVETLVVVFSLLMAASTISTLIGTEIVGIAGTGQSQKDKEEHWDFATQWSFPKLETLRIIMPGVFGYRLQEFMTTKDKSAAYWGRVGEDPRLVLLESPDPDVRAATLQSMIGDSPQSQQAIEAIRGNSDLRTQIMDVLRHQMQLRHSGNGEYAGVLIFVFALIAIINALRPASPFSTQEKLMVGFFACAALFALMMCWGRFFGLYAPLYYHLPYFSTIRNPIKFLHPFHIAWITLGGFGLEAFYRNYLRPPKPVAVAPLTPTPVPVAAPALAKPVAPVNRWDKLPQFDKLFTVGLLATFAIAVVGWLLYAGSKRDLVNYLVHHGFNDDIPDRLASGMAQFSIHEAAWFVFFLGLTSAVVLAALAGFWSGWKSKLCWAALCAIVIIDLGRSDLPWVRYFDYDQKYSENEITKFLKDKPYEYRVVGRLDPHGGYDLPGNDGNFGAIIHWWLENDFPYNNIQSLEIDQMPRQSYMEGNYLGNLIAPPGSPNSFQIAARLWKLTSTRYILASADMLPKLNSIDPAHPQFHYLKRFDLDWKPGVTYPEDAGDLYPNVNDNGQDALIEYDGALPRAKLFSYWIGLTNDMQILGGLADPRFNPDLGVLVSVGTNQAAVPPTSKVPGLEPGTVEITDYKPKDIQLKASAKTPAVLLYNDRYDDDWHAWVDGKPVELLRCNFIMRGVFLTPGDHTIEFRFIRPLKYLYVTLAAMGAGLVLGLCLLCSRFTGKPFGKVGEESTSSNEGPALK